MRTRKEIEENKWEDYKNKEELILEILLDIRDLLNKYQDI